MSCAPSSAELDNLEDTVEHDNESKGGMDRDAGLDERDFFYGMKKVFSRPPFSGNFPSVF